MSTTTFGAWLRHARNAHDPKISQERLAELTGIDRGYLSRIENDKVGLPLAETRQRLHRALGTSDADLVSAGVPLRDDYTAPAPAISASATIDRTANPFPSGDIRWKLVEAMKQIPLDGPDHATLMGFFALQLRMYRDLITHGLSEIEETMELVHAPYYPDIDDSSRGIG